MIHSMQSLFKEEVEELNVAKEVYDKSRDNGNIPIEHYMKLISSYERNLKSMMKITKISDSQQIYLRNIQEQLEKEINERKKVEEKLKYFAFTDHMTGVSNRRVGFMLLKEEVRNCIEENKYFSICYIDIDGLKKVNDEYGHLEGDFLIKTIVKTIKEFIEDTHHICRMGGDEFTIIFPEYHLQDAQETTGRIIKRLNEINKENIKPYRFSISYGIKEINKNTKFTNTDELIKAVDELMYNNKNSKKLNQNY